MFCRNCGKKLSDNAAFCAYCGTKVEISQPSSEIIAAKPEPDAVIPDQNNNTVEIQSHPLASVTENRAENANVNGTIAEENQHTEIKSETDITKENQIAEKDNAIQEKDNAIQEKNKAITEKNKRIEEKKKAKEETKRTKEENKRRKPKSKRRKEKRKKGKKESQKRKRRHNCPLHNYICGDCSRRNGRFSLLYQRRIPDRKEYEAGGGSLRGGGIPLRFEILWHSA